MCSNIRNIFIKCLQIEEDDDEDTDSINDNDSRSLEAKTDENEPNNSKNSKISENDIKNINSGEGGVNPEIIDQVVAEMDDIAQMKMVQELAKVRRRVSIVPDTTTIIEDQFLEPMAAETGIESDKGADRLTRNDRKRMVRRISIKLAREEKEHIKKMDLAESSTIGGGKEARKSIRNEARKSENHSDNQNNNSNSSNHNRRSSILHKEHYITENQDIRNQLTNYHNFVTGQEAVGEEHDFLSERSSSSFIEDDTVQNKTEPAAAPFLNSNQCYDKRLEKFRRNTLISLHRGSVGAAEQSQGLIIGQESQKTSNSSFHDLNKELDKNSRMSVSRKIINNNNPEESMKARRESMKIIEKKSSIVHERTKSISRRDGSAMPKLVDNEENVSSYPLPGTEYSTKMGGTWRPSQYARNLLTEDEITEVVNKAFDEEMQTN